MKPPKVSAGLLMFRRGEELQVFLAHPGGPIWAAKDEGAWTIPKGLIDVGENPLDAAIREFREETGLEANGPYLSLGEITQKSGKVVQAWAFEGDADPAVICSNTCRIQWPPRSGKYIDIPEVDRCEWFSSPQASGKMNPAQVEFLDRLKAQLD